VRSESQVDLTRVLICDDVDLLRELLRYELEADDDVVVVGEAADGADAVRLVEELRPNIVVIDLAMSGLDGLEAIALTRELPAPPAILVVSGFDAGTMGERALALGANRYVEKRGNLAEVKAAVRELIDESRG
jgi:DNA-binding NarL/FixJ family response regulator